MPFDRTAWIDLLDHLGPINRGGRGEGVDEVQDFLTRFGYLDPSHPPTDTVDDATVEALTRYQGVHALERTGMLDDATRAQMQESRCGMPDADALGFSTRCAWDRRTLSYAFDNGTGDIAGTGEQDAVRAAFATWTAAVPSLQFREVSLVQSPDIRIDFRNAADPDRSMVGTVLAHADFPPGCSIIAETLPKPLHYDDSEHTWCVGAVAGQFDVETVALHEIGHLLGLQHTSVGGAVMFPSVTSGGTNRVLQQDDLDGIRSLYPPTWRPIGGFFPAAAPLGSVDRTPDNLDVFVTGNDGRVYTSWWFQGVDWSGTNDNWRSIGGFFPVGAPVAPVARGPQNLDLFITGNDGRVYTSWWFNGADWSGVNDNWRSIGGFFPAGAPVTAVARRPDHLDLFVTGNDGRVYTSWWQAGQDWSGVNDNWRSIGGFFPIGAPLAVAARKSDHLDVFITGNDGWIYTSWWHAGIDWSGINDNWPNLGGTFPVGAPLAATTRNPDHLDVWVTGNDGRVYTTWWHQGRPWGG